MKMRFKLAGKGSLKTIIDVTVEAPRYELTREEVKRWKQKLQNSIHQVLRDDGYNVDQIKLS